MREATQRERKFIELVIAGMPDFTAARLAGYSRAMARNTAWKIWKKRSVAEYFRRVIEQSAPPPQVPDGNRTHVPSTGPGCYVAGDTETAGQACSFVALQRPQPNLLTAAGWH